MEQETHQPKVTERLTCGKKFGQKDSWMNILSRYLHLQTDEITIDGKLYTKRSFNFSTLPPITSG
jgi:hypothetical protein